ncbi:hypothetical protein [Streptomyces sp. KLOTTS4A1]|uniref:hypothetical protein n=1 Tax=Streptomyces sp. KLOTTS4A1 TaxID=3390996 RepID=UPI0039F5AB60
MPSTADELLADLEPLPHTQRPRQLALTARSLAESGELPDLLAELDARGPYERRLAALAALSGRQAGFLAARLSDPDRVVRGYALAAARTFLPDAAIEAAYADASEALRRDLGRIVAGKRRTELAERLLVRLHEQWGDTEAARLLAACSAGFVAAWLPRLAHAVTSWASLARHHPDLLLDHAESELAAQRQRQLRAAWWELHAGAVAAVAQARPERVLTLLELYGPARLPHQLRDRLGRLVKADAERTVRWFLAPEREMAHHERVWSPGVLRRLVQADPPSLPLLGRHWLKRPGHLAALLRAMPPSRRSAFLDGCTDEPTSRDEPLPDAVLDVLPRERQWAEARYWAPKGRAEEWYWGDVLQTLSYAPPAEAVPDLLAALRRPDAQERAMVWPWLVACLGRGGDRAAMTELLGLMLRLRNEQDPVRASALGALAGLHPRLFAAEDVVHLDRILLDALEARDSSTRTRDTLRRLAVGLLVEHAGDDAPGARPGSGLLAWSLRALERIVAHAGTMIFGPLHRTLRRGQEHDLFEALRPRLEAEAQRADFGLLFAFAGSLGTRARTMPVLQDMLEQALKHGSDSDFTTATRLWLGVSASPDDRVASLLERDPSAAVLAPVQQILARRRTDLLDVLLGEEPPYGRFLTAGSRRPVPDLTQAGRWLPRQQEAALRLAAAVVADESRPLYERAEVLGGAAHIPLHGPRLVAGYAASADTVLAEAALGALPWTDRPGESLPLLLSHAGGERARVAVYAASRTARFVAPSVLSAQLGELLSAKRAVKVTSRKEAVRLAARLLPVRGAAELLTATYRAPEQHPDVRAAVVCELAPLLDVPEAWDLLDEAVRGDSRIQQAVTGPSPRQLPAVHRPRYARLIGELCRSGEHDVAWTALLALPQWADEAPDVAARLSSALTDLEDRSRLWSAAARSLQQVAVSELPHPAGGAAEGSVLHTTVAELLQAVRRGEYEALDDRDLPARQRLLSLVGGLPDEPAGLARPVLESLAAQLAEEATLTEARARILGRLVDLRADPPELMTRLGALAQAVVGRPVLAAELGRSLSHPASYDTVLGSQPGPLAAARHLAADGVATTGLLAVGLVANMGVRLRWPEEWRGLLRELRRHRDPDVRHAAFTATTERE